MLEASNRLSDAVIAMCSRAADVMADGGTTKDLDSLRSSIVRLENERWVHRKGSCFARAMRL